MRKEDQMAILAPSTFATLLEQAVNEPGILSSAYRAFHNYSIGNQLLAWSQCVERGIPLGPIATYQRWRELGRHVRRGERAITLCRPVTVKRTTTADDGTEESSAATWFVFKPFWFVLSQTDGQMLPEPYMPAWDRAGALAALGIIEAPFDSLNGNVMGFARGRTIAVSPINPLPLKTTFHELAHVVLGHTQEAAHADGELTPRNLREVEAESVALLCLAALNQPGVEHCRGYVQAWWGVGNAIPERSAQRILKPADQILRAGRNDTTEDV
jgi:antirestriction protein ArdC